MSDDTRRISRPLLVAPLLIAIAWFYVSQTIAAQAAHGIALTVGLGEYEPLFSAIFAFFLTLTGFAAIAWIGSRQGDLRQLLALPQRPTWAREWGAGAAVGWGVVIACVLPMALAGELWPQFWLTGPSVWLTVVALLTLAISTLLAEAVFRGYPFRLLVECIGPTAATVLMSAVFAFVHPLGFGSATLSFLGSFLLGVLLSLAYLRTHGLWLSWGLHFAWAASMGVLFGLPVQGQIDLSTLVELRAIGPVWMTGGGYGPAGSLWALLALLGAIIVLVRVTRDYAWNYTHAPIVPGGYPMEAQAPPAHAAMEQEAQARAGALVQIQPPPPASPLPSLPPTHPGETR